MQYERMIGNSAQFLRGYDQVWNMVNGTLAAYKQEHRATRWAMAQRVRHDGQCHHALSRKYRCS